jgi:hypothetical protein
MQSVSFGRSRQALIAVSRHVRNSAARIRRMRARQERVLRALNTELPPGVSRVDWVARMLNNQ